MYLGSRVRENLSPEILGLKILAHVLVKGPLSNYMHARTSSSNILLADSATISFWEMVFCRRNWTPKEDTDAWQGYRRSKVFCQQACSSILPPWSRNLGGNTFVLCDCILLVCVRVGILGEGGKCYTEVQIKMHGIL